MLAEQQERSPHLSSETVSNKRIISSVSTAVTGKLILRSSNKARPILVPMNLSTLNTSFSEKYFNTSMFYDSDCILTWYGFFIDS